MTRPNTRVLLSVIIILQICSAVQATVFAIPGTGYLPASVRAACRASLAKNITECSSALMFQENDILPEDLNTICTAPCLTALNSMRSSALTACGTASVDMPVDNLQPPTTIPITPLDFADELVYRYQMVCLRDMSLNLYIGLEFELTAIYAIPMIHSAKFN
ncbi:hypothetical protein VE03_07058 [Pseudogymnoascus sp. 23342-1-I1]|nr:hypothetical protein VE03_07058 [Pseudogymnoascus sp. 23342-1-I1]